jgi:hypothetical protein
MHKERIRGLIVANWPRQPCQPRVAHDGDAGAWERARPGTPHEARANGEAARRARGRHTPCNIQEQWDTIEPGLVYR